MLPIRVAGWQREASGRWAVFGRTDQLLAGLERAVDPDGDGATDDHVPIAVVGVNSPYAGFEDSPEARAVGGAMRGNPLPIVVPCHRVLPSGGGLGGFGGRPDLKRRLLEIEGWREPEQLKLVP